MSAEHIERVVAKWPRLTLAIHYPELYEKINQIAGAGPFDRGFQLYSANRNVALG
jgi:hypothetical protein